MKANDKKILARFTQYLYARRGLGEVTVGNYLSTLNRLIPVLGSRPKPREVEHHIMEMRKSGTSYSHITNTSLHLERYCEFMKIPLKLGRPLKPKPLIRGTLSEAEVTLLLAACPTPRQRVILSVLAYSGMRNKELCNLRIGDVDIPNQLLRVRGSKTQKDRYVSIAPACLALLLDYLHERQGTADDPLFLTARRKLPLEPQDVRKMVKTMAERAGIKKRVHPHLLRHSLATNMLHRGASLMTIKEQLGHVYIEATMIYLHYAPARVQAEYRMFAPSYL
jgi:site-specific recombinase XerD